MRGLATSNARACFTEKGDTMAKMTFQDEFNKVYLQSTANKKECLRVTDAKKGVVALAACADTADFKWSFDGKKLSQCVADGDAKCSDATFAYTQAKVEFDGAKVPLKDKNQLVEGTVQDGKKNCLAADAKRALTIAGTKGCVTLLATYALDA